MHDPHVCADAGAKHVIVGTTLGELREVLGRALLLRAELSGRRADGYRLLLAPQVPFQHCVLCTSIILACMCRPVQTGQLQARQWPRSRLARQVLVSLPSPLEIASKISIGATLSAAVTDLLLMRQDIF